MNASAVLLADVHYALSTLELADSSVRQGIDEAARLAVPLIIAGDLNDTKDILRGKCANAMIESMKYAKTKGVKVYILIGNHDLLNEKGDAHSLNFLRPYATILDTPGKLVIPGLTAYYIPYQNELGKVRRAFEAIPKGELVIMHQGILGAYMGEYVVDKTSVAPEELVDWKVISGHYHRHQTVGTVTYIGSPYSTTFAEAGDGVKGFQILFENGSMRQVPTNLRKHTIIETDILTCTEANEAGADPFPIPGVTDVIWVKLSGPAVELDQISKKQFGLAWFGHQNYRLDRIPTDVEVKLEKLETMTPDEMIDELIEQNEPCMKQDRYLKALWREIMV